MRHPLTPLPFDIQARGWHAQNGRGRSRSAPPFLLSGRATRTFALLALAAAAPAVGFAQDYIFRPGPRGFDPSLNRYGSTEESRPRKDSDDPSRTTVKVEILQDGTAGGLSTQQWSKTFADLGYAARIRQPISSDKEEVTETTRGPLRFVSVVGRLDRRGNLVFPGRTFVPGDAARLGEWLDELKTYGAQGSPEGQPLWGLSRSQFEAIYSALSRRVTADVAGLPLEEAAAALDIPREYPLRFGVDARATAREPGGPAGVSRSVAGLTTGTALAFVLNEYGLGFRPERTPEGKIALAVEPLPPPAKPTARDEPPALVVWPVGWDVEEPAAPADRKAPVRDQDAVPPTRAQLAPALLRQREELGFDDAALTEVFAAAEEETDVPILLDRAGVAGAGIDLAKARVSTRPRNTSWNVVLRAATFGNRLRHELRRDEGGKPLVWITPLRAGR